MESPDKPKIDREAWEANVSRLKLTPDVRAKLFAADDETVEMILRSEEAKERPRGHALFLKMVMERFPTMGYDEFEAKYGFVAKYFIQKLSQAFDSKYPERK
jgi:hypothetical protein